MHARLETITAERDALAAKVARVEALVEQWTTALPKFRKSDRYRLGVHAARADLIDALRGNP
jgi:cupin superfamily acireductone dioxygenase involved in methionine salvage